MNNHLERIPPELVKCIAQYLQLTELCSLRLTCKALAAKTSYFFAHTYCHQISTNLSLASIERLEALSQSAWAKSVRVFCMRWDVQAGQGVNWDRLRHQPARKYRKSLPPHSDWDRDSSLPTLADLPIIRRICTIILRFTNCRSFEVKSCDAEYYASDHYTSGAASLITYVLRGSDLLKLGFILAAETGLQLDTFRIKFGDVAVEANRPKATRITLTQINERDFRDMLINPKELAPRLNLEDGPYEWLWRLEEASKKMLSGSRELALLLGRCGRSRPWKSGHWCGYRPAPEYEWARSYAARAVHGQRLTWMLWCNEPFHYDVSGLPDIEDLTFSRANLKATSLKAILQRSRPHLQRLDLSEITLDQDWRGIIRYLASFDHLESVSLRDLSMWEHSNPENSAPKPCIFPWLDDSVEVPGSHGRLLELRKTIIGVYPQRIETVTGVDYSGPGIQNFLHLLCHKIVEPYLA
jgi:hypothetical protein